MRRCCSIGDTGQSVCISEVPFAGLNLQQGACWERWCCCYRRRFHRCHCRRRGRCCWTVSNRHMIGWSAHALGLRHHHNLRSDLGKVALRARVPSSSIDRVHLVIGIYSLSARTESQFQGCRKTGHAHNKDWGRNSDCDCHKGRIVSFQYVLSVGLSCIQTAESSWGIDLCWGTSNGSGV